MEIKPKYVSPASERSKKYYSYKEGGLKSAIRDSSVAWKWVEIFNTDIIDKEITLPDYINLEMSAEYKKLSIISKFNQYGKITIDNGTTVYIKGTDFYLGYETPDIDSSNCIFTLKSGSTLILDASIFHVRYKSNLIIESGAKLVLKNNGFVSYEAPPDTLDLNGTYINEDTNVEAPLIDSSLFKVPVLKKFYMQSTSLSSYDFFESIVEYYNNDEHVINNKEYIYFTEDKSMSSEEYIVDIDYLFYNLNYFYNRNLIETTINITLNKENDQDLVEITPSTINTLIGLPIEKTVISNVTNNRAIPKSISINGQVYSDSDIFDGINYFIPGVINCSGTDEIIINFDYKYTYSFNQNGKVIYENTVWKDSIIENLIPENVLLVNNETFVVNGITYDLNSGIEFLGWKFNNISYDFSLPISQNMTLIADERIVI